MREEDDRADASKTSCGKAGEEQVPQRRKGEPARAGRRTGSQRGGGRKEGKIKDRVSAQGRERGEEMRPEMSAEDGRGWVRVGRARGLGLSWCSAGCLFVYETHHNMAQQSTPEKVRFLVSRALEVGGGQT